MVPLWIRNVLSLCNAKGGKITSEEVANVAATAGKYGLGSTLVSALKKNRHLHVEVIGEQPGQRHQTIKIYRITRKEPTV